MKFPDDLNIADYFLFDRLGEGLGNKPAIRFGSRGYTYGAIADRTKALERYFESVGVVREQRIYTVLPDTPPFAWATFATLAHGAVIAMGNPAAPTKDLAYVVDYSRCAVLVTLPKVADELADVLRAAPSLRAVLLVPDVATGDDPEGTVRIPESLKDAPFEALALTEAISRGRKVPGERPATRRDDICVWLFTSGSTGTPKAAMHTHRDFAFNTEVYAKGTVGYRRDDITVSVPRLFFGYATGTNLWFPFAVGATTALFAERPTAEVVAKAITDYKPTIVTNVPTMLSKLLDYDDKLTSAGEPALDMSSIRFHLSAGEALPPALLTRFRERYNCDIYDGIGSAEMFHIYASNRPDDIKPGSLGRVVDGYQIEILDRDATGPGAPALPAGETGVMWVRGDSVALGYFQDRDKSWETFHGHWCRTGDLFRIDADGYLWFSGRADDIFKVSGLFVAPLEVEDCLMRHEAVGLAVVIAAEENGLTKPKAFVVLREGDKGRVADEAGRAALAEELQNHVKAALTAHKYPRWVVFVDDLPKNDRGKVDRKLLVEREKAGENPSA